MDTAAVTEHGPNKWLRTDASTAAKENAAYNEFKQNLSKDDIKKLKAIAKDLLQKIKEQLAAMDHPFDKQETRAALQNTIRDLLWIQLPESYTEENINYYRSAVYNYISRQYGGVA